MWMEGGGAGRLPSGLPGSPFLPMRRGNIVQFQPRSEAFVQGQSLPGQIWVAQRGNRPEGWWGQ